MPEAGNSCIIKRKSAMNRTPAKVSKEVLLKELGTSAQGLTEKEAKLRLYRNGKNVISSESSASWPKIFLRQYKNPLVLILIIASLISFFTGNRLDATIIIFMMVLNSALSFFQEYRSEKAASLLKKKVGLKSTVIRDGIETKISTESLVVGDVVKVSPGSIIPADLRLLEVNNLTIDEAIITGESFPVDKQAEALKTSSKLPQNQLNLAFLGTSVQSGEGLGVVYATGKRTELGKTASSLDKTEPETEFQSGTRRFGNLLVVLITILVIFIFFVNIGLKPLIFHQHPDLLESLLFSLALAIGITPELLPLIITLNLSKGALLMSKKHVIVKKLIAIEDIGNADVLCTDKTGTITEGKIFLENYFNYDGRPDTKLLLYGLLSNERSLSAAPFGLDQALAEFPGTKSVANQAANYKVLDQLPFDFERKRTTSLVNDGKETLLLSKGAAEPLLAICSQIMINDQPTILLGHHRRILREKFIQLSSQGYRLLALASKKPGTKQRLKKNDEKELTFCGFLAFSDRPKDTAASTLHELAKLNVQIKILTGDNEYVAKHVCQEVGLEIAGVVTGAVVEKQSEDELKTTVLQNTVFAKITPNHKLRLIQAIKAAGHTVAFLGDGVNDTPALKAADVGISVDSASDVAKEAADVILLHKSLEVLIEAVRGGRRTFGNSMKYLYNTSSSNFGNMFSLAAASLFLPFIPMLPSQVILLNFISDLPSLAIATDNVDADYLKKPKHWDLKEITSFMIPFGLLSSLFDLTTFFLLIYISTNLLNPQSIFRTGWFLESLLTEIFVIFLIRTRRPFWKSRPSQLVVIMSFLAFAVGMVLLLTPIGRPFQFVTLPKQILLFIAAIVALYIFLFEIGKALYYRKREF